MALFGAWLLWRSATLPPSPLRSAQPAAAAFSPLARRAGARGLVSPILGTPVTQALTATAWLRSVTSTVDSTVCEPPAPKHLAGAPCSMGS
jgi:hypothetical protein